MLARWNEYFLQQTQKPIGELATDEPGPVLEAEGFRFECLEPMRRWSLDVRDAENDVTIALEYESRCEPYKFRRVQLPGKYAGAVNQGHYTQAGRYRGVIRVGGKEYREIVGMKNRSWGVRNWHKLPMYHWTTAQFPDFSVNTWHYEDQDGSTLYLDGALTTEKGEVTPIVKVEHDLELRPGSSKRVLARHVRLTTADGREFRMEGREVTGIPIGILPGRWSESDPEALAQAEEAALWYEQHMIFTIGDQRGVGFVEHCVGPGSARHGIRPTPFPYLNPAGEYEAPAE